LPILFFKRASAMKQIFLISMLICFAVTLLLSFMEPNLSGWKGIWIFEFFPGINGLASQGNYPATTKIGMNMAFVCGLLIAPMMFSKIDVKGFENRLTVLSGSQKILYSIAVLGLIAAVLFISPEVRSHQMSSQFFSLVATNRFFLAIFVASFNALNVISFLFPLLLILRKRNHDNN
jgi:hypothetical protein